MAVAPHALASQSALAVLREGGNALEAMIAAAATIAVVYPHMNSIGGDSFWLVHVPGATPRGIDACGAAARGGVARLVRGARASRARSRSAAAIAANTVAGTISGWALAYEMRRELGGKLPLSRLLADAIHYARDRDPGHAQPARQHRREAQGARAAAGVRRAFLPGGDVPATGALVRAAEARRDARAARARGPRRISTAATSRARLRRTSPRPARPSRSPTSKPTRRSGVTPLVARALARHASTTCRRRRRALVSLADPRPARPARHRRARPGRRGLRASRGRGDQARLPRIRDRTSPTRPT